MSKNRKRHRLLPALLATALGLALSFQLPTPATAAAPQADLTPVTTDKPEPRSLVFQADPGNDAGVQATITCQIFVSNPFRSGRDIRAAATVNCTAPVLSIEAAVSLWQEGFPSPIAQTYDLRLGVSTLTVGAGAVCENGTYAVVGASILIPPPGYSPSPAVIWDESDAFAVTC